MKASFHPERGFHKLPAGQRSFRLWILEEFHVVAGLQRNAAEQILERLFCHLGPPGSAEAPQQHGVNMLTDPEDHINRTKREPRRLLSWISVYTQQSRFAVEGRHSLVSASCKRGSVR